MKSKRNQYIELKLTYWLKHEAWNENLLVMSEVECNIDAVKVLADVVSVKSRSNTLHIYEVETNANPKTINAALWQINGFYSNYKTLVISTETYFQIRNSAVFDSIVKYGVGIVTFTGRGSITFKRVKRAKYREGVYLEHWPSVVANRNCT
jgi:hypothetical protein